MTLGERIRARRRELDLTQEEVAAGAKIYKSHICEIERGNRLPSIPVLIDIAATLNVDIGYFFENAGKDTDNFCKMYMRLPKLKKDKVRRVVREMLR